MRLACVLAGFGPVFFFGCAAADPHPVLEPEAGAPKVVDAALDAGAMQSPWADAGNLAVVPEPDAMAPQPKTIAAQSLSVGYYEACAVKLDGTTACWGRALFPEVPQGTLLKRIMTSVESLCGVTTEDRVRCWGNNTLGQTDAPDVAFRDVSVGGGGGCLIDLSGALQCWGTIVTVLPSPLPRLERVYLGRGDREAVCGINAAGELMCWGQFQVPTAGVYRFVAVGNGYGCALDERDNITCFGGNGVGQGSPPEGITFATVSALTAYSCGLGTDERAYCWGPEAFGVTKPPAGAFSDVRVGANFACGIRKLDQRVQCWGSNSYGQCNVPLDEGSK